MALPLPERLCLSLVVGVISSMGTHNEGS